MRKLFAGTHQFKKKLFPLTARESVLPDGPKIGIPRRPRVTTRRKRQIWSVDCYYDSGSRWFRGKSKSGNCTVKRPSDGYPKKFRANVFIPKRQRHYSPIASTSDWHLPYTCRILTLPYSPLIKTIQCGLYHLTTKHIIDAKYWSKQICRRLCRQEILATIAFCKLSRGHKKWHHWGTKEGVNRLQIRK